MVTKIIAQIRKKEIVRFPCHGPVGSPFHVREKQKQGIDGPVYQRWRPTVASQRPVAARSSQQSSPVIQKKKKTHLRCKFFFKKKSPLQVPLRKTPLHVFLMQYKRKPTTRSSCTYQTVTSLHSLWSFSASVPPLASPSCLIIPRFRAEFDKDTAKNPDPSRPKTHEQCIFFLQKSCIDLYRTCVRKC